MTNDETRMNETPPAEPVVSGSPLKGGEEPCNPQLLLLLVPVPLPLPLPVPDSLPEKTLGRLGFRRSKVRTGTGTGTGTGTLKTPERQSLFGSHRQRRWFHEAMSVVYPQTERGCSFLTRTVCARRKTDGWHEPNCASRQGTAGRIFTLFDIRHSTFIRHWVFRHSSFVSKGCTRTFRTRH